MFASFSRYQPQALSLLRIIAGLMFLCHGTAKVLGLPAVEGVPPPGLSLAGLSGPLELVLGALLALGLFTRPAAFLATGFCAVGYWMIHGMQGFFPDPERRRDHRPLLLRLALHRRRRPRPLVGRRGDEARLTRSPLLSEKEGEIDARTGRLSGDANAQKRVDSVRRTLRGAPGLRLLLLCASAQ